jgi:hypothetical protein
LLAAHCIQNKKNPVPSGPQFYQIQFTNRVDLDSNESKEISDFHLHPDWDHQSDDFKADIAIVVLKELIDFTPNISKICFNTPKLPIKKLVGRNATVAGWGITETSSRMAVEDLRGVKVPIVKQSLCDASKRLQRYNADTLFCAGSRDNVTGPCRGNFQ